MMEVWKDIHGFEDLYQVSSFGNVRSITNRWGSRHKPKLLSPLNLKSGYPIIKLWRGGKYKRVQVSKLVANTFLDNPHGHQIVRHKDGDTLNNHIENLFWTAGLTTNVVCISNDVIKVYFNGSKYSDKHFIVDLSAIDLVLSHNWSASRKHNKLYVVTSMSGKTRYLHQLLLNIDSGNQLEVDHINGNPLDNRKSNLRECTHSSNMKNISSRRSKTGYIGVYPEKNSSKYVARIQSDNKPIHVGTFDSIEEAAKARDAAAIQYHGEFANLNFL